MKLPYDSVRMRDSRTNEMPQILEQANSQLSDPRN